MKTISVLVAAFKARQWLPDCINSIYSQELPANWQLEVLLGVDGCDDTLQAAKQLKTACPDLCVIHLQSNMGTYITFNTLLRYAKGDLISRFDADDVMKPDFLARQIPEHEAGADITRTWSIFTDTDLQPTDYVIAHEVYHPKGGLSTRPSDGQFMVNARAMRHLGGLRSWRCGADTEFNKRLRIAGYKHSVVEEFLYFRRTHEASLTANPDTNFQSPFRISIQKKTDEYEKQYQAGLRSVVIQPEYCEDHVCL